MRLQADLPAASEISNSESEGLEEVAQQLQKLVAWNVHEGRFGKCNCRKCKESSSPWRCLLMGLKPKLAEARQRVALEVVGFDQLMCDERGSALAAQTCSLCFLWLTDLVQQHPLCDTHAYRGIHGAWPSPVTELPPAVAKSLYGAALPPLRQDALSGADDNVLLGHYTALCKETAAVFLGQMKACECPSLATFNNYTQASLDLRRRYAWSIPTEEALRGIAALGPLLEIGCGTGYWASLLRSRGADIKCFNSSAWVSEFNEKESGELGQCGLSESETFGEVLAGGAEVIGQHHGRTLILMWPDYFGRGGFGLKCLEAYEGEYLVLVGEWQGRTFGSYSDGLEAHGQSFALEFQHEVAAVYHEHAVFRLPNWPLFADCAVVYKRKSLEELIQQQTPASAGQDLLAAFFAGSHDPFAALGLLAEEGEIETESAQGAAGDGLDSEQGAARAVDNACSPAEASGRAAGGSAGTGAGDPELDVEAILRSSEVGGT